MQSYPWSCAGEGVPVFQKRRIQTSAHNQRGFFGATILRSGPVHPSVSLMDHWCRWPTVHGLVKLPFADNESSVAASSVVQWSCCEQP